MCFPFVHLNYKKANTKKQNEPSGLAVYGPEQGILPK